MSRSERGRGTARPTRPLGETEAGDPAGRTPLRTRKGAILLLVLLVGFSAHPAYAAPVLIHHETSAYYEWTARFSNVDLPWLEPVLGTGPSPNFTLPGFDTSLGTLLSARLDIDGGLASRLLTHAGRPFGTAVTIASAEVRGRLVSTSGLFVPLNLATSHPQITTFDIGLPPFSDSPFAEIFSTRSVLGGLDRTYAGADLMPFLDQPVGFRTRAPNWQHIYHESDPLPGLLEYPDPNVIQPGTVPGPASAVLLLARVLNLNLGDGDHPVVFSDAHLSAAMQWDMRVTYTYEPFQTGAPQPPSGTAPEPAALALFGSGLLAVAWTRRRVRVRPAHRAFTAATASSRRRSSA